MTILGEIAATISLAQFAWNGTKWVLKRHKDQDSPIGSNKNDHLNFDVEVYSFPRPTRSIFQNVIIRKKEFREESRLNATKETLFSKYHKTAGNRLTSNNIGVETPYIEIVSLRSPPKFDSNPDYFIINPTLKLLHDEVIEGLGNFFERQNIIYVPDILVRLQKAPVKPGVNAIIQPVPYDNVFSTNLVVDLKAKEIGQLLPHPRKPHDLESLRDYDLALSSVEGELPPLEKSILANPIGVAGIAISSDNRLLLANRGANVSCYQNVLGPSASGYVKWRDVKDGNCLLENAMKPALLREIREELFIEEHDVREFCFLGLFREFYRGGMPQAFFIFRTKPDSKEIAERIARSKLVSEFTGMVTVPTPSVDSFHVRSRTLCTIGSIAKWNLGLETVGILTAASVNFPKECVIER